MVKPLDPKSIPKYVNQLVIPPVYMPTVLRQPMTGQVIGHEYKINVSEFQQQILPAGFGTTKVFGYGGMIQDQNTGRAVYFRSVPGPTFEAIRGIPVHVQWINTLLVPIFSRLIRQSIGQIQMQWPFLDHHLHHFHQDFP